MDELTPGQHADIRAELQHYADFLHYVDLSVDLCGRVRFVSRLNGQVFRLYDLADTET